MKKQLLCYILACLGISTLSAQEVVRVSVGDNQNYGITYTAPALRVKVKVSARCTTIKAGIFAPYAEKYLGLTDVPMEDQVAWEVASYELETETVADTSRTFHINFSDKVLPPTFYLGPQGQLLGINRAPEIVSVEETPMEVPAEPKAEMHAANVMNEELLKAGSRSKQAEIAARQIFRIRESRLNLLTGDVDNLPADGASFQIVMDNLAAQEAAYMELFTGVKTTTSVFRQFIYLPTGEANSILFRFSRHFGFVDADDLSGEPYRLSVSITEDKRKVPVQLDAKGKPKPQATGIAYIVPGKAKVSLSYKGKELKSEEWSMSQFGHVEHLSSTQFTNKKAPSSALFDSQTGAIELFSAQ